MASSFSSAARGTGLPRIGSREPAFRRRAPELAEVRIQERVSAREADVPADAAVEAEAAQVVEDLHALFERQRRPLAAVVAMLAAQVAGLRDVPLDQERRRRHERGGRLRGDRKERRVAPDARTRREQNALLRRAPERVFHDRNGRPSPPGPPSRAGSPRPPPSTPAARHPRRPARAFRPWPDRARPSRVPRRAEAPPGAMPSAGLTSPHSRQESGSRSSVGLISNRPVSFAAGVAAFETSWRVHSSRASSGRKSGAPDPSFIAARRSGSDSGLAIPPQAFSSRGHAFGPISARQTGNGSARAALRRGFIFPHLH